METEEGRRFRLVLLELQDVLTLCSSGFPRIIEKVEKDSAPFRGKEEGLSNLRILDQGLVKIRGELETLVDWIEAGPPSVDPARIPSTGKAAKLEGYVSLDELLSRLNSSSET